MNKPKSTSLKPTKAQPVFPAPEWTSLSASLAAALAHEVRNPLLAIKGAAQLLEQVVGADDKSLAQLIIAEAQRIEQLVATMDPLTPDPSQISEALNIHEVTEYVRLAASGFAKDVKFITQYDPSLPPVRGAREALIQAFLNLVKNSVEALHEAEMNFHRGAGAGGKSSPLAGEDLDEGAAENPLTQPSPARGEGSQAARFTPTITFVTRYLVGEHMQRPDGKRLHLQVSIQDNGPGVPEAVVPRLFTPFSSGKTNGKGLGLAIVAKIIEEHGGLVAYNAPPEGGARFTVFLPVA